MDLSVKINRANALKALQAMPEDLGRAMRLALKAGTRDIQVAARQDHKFTPRSGNADRSISTQVDGLKGRVFLDTGIAPYAPGLHEGTGVHGPRGQAIQIHAKKGQFLRWVYQGKYVYMRSVVIQGIKGDPFLYRAAERERPGFEKRIDRNIAKVIKDRGL